VVATVPVANAADTIAVGWDGVWVGGWSREEGDTVVRVDPADQPGGGVAPGRPAPGGADNPTAAPPDDDFEPDGAVYNMVGAGRTLYVVEANHGEIDRVDPGSGRIRRVLDISACRPHITPTAMTRRGGHLYVGNLGSFPIQRGASIIFRVDRHGRHQRVVATGLTAVLGLAFDRQGRLYPWRRPPSTTTSRSPAPAGWSG
jgi:hypothetical protein